ncbi:MAG: hypothetical protein K5921_00175 [Lachnospiraceae bacterium]|nr:hypothetical protein [Lachnospiraceae bacterium]
MNILGLIIVVLLLVPNIIYAVRNRDQSNRCGFHIVEFYNKFHPDPNDHDREHRNLDDQFPDGMFRFEKVINGDCHH